MATLKGLILTDAGRERRRRPGLISARLLISVAGVYGACYGGGGDGRSAGDIADGL